MRLVTVKNMADTAEAIGLTGFATESSGIGGNLKSRVYKINRI